MDGIFKGKKRMILPVMFLVFGLFFVGVAIAMNVVDSAVNTGWIFILIMGIAYAAGAIAMILFNRGAYIRVGENSIKAKYHWGGRLDCAIDEVAFVLPELNTLRILLKNGKQHVIMGVENSWDLGFEIRRQGFALETESPDSLRRQLEQLQKTRKKALWWVIGGIALMFVNIFVTVLLTGARDMVDFSDADWTCFGIMGATEALTVAGTFYMALRCGKLLLPIEQRKYRLRIAVIASEPLPSNHIAGVYTDGNCSGRIVVCGFPNDESVYYCVQEIAGDFALETVHTSEIYDSEDDLDDERFSELIDITSAITSR